MKQVAPYTKKAKGYLWAYFTGEGKGAEAISLSLSKGNDALNWYTLNEGKAIIYSKEGEKGLRDPFILRSHDNKKFYLLATDLKIYQRPNNSFETAQVNGSRYIEIFESKDLIHWSEQRHVLVSSKYVGNTWAPKAFWDSVSNQYLVFWASNLYDEENPVLRNEVNYNRLIYVTTKDFQTFSEPKIWVDVNLGKGHGTIDASVVKEGDWYYRFMKEEETMTIRLDRTKNIFASVIGESYAAKDASENEWCTLGEKIAVGLPNGEGKLFTSGEGPCVFYANEEDVNGHRWFLFIDQPSYHGGPDHYIGFASKNIEASNSWIPVSDKLRNGLPQNSKGEKPRHGSIISLTEEEYQRIYQNYNVSKSWREENED